MKAVLAALLALAATPAFAATGDYGFVSLRNTDFIVLLAFLVFVGILLYYKVPAKVGGMLDSRAAGIRAELDEARALREEAQSLLASYERKQKDVQAQADRIVTSARDEARKAGEQAKQDIKASVARRLATAEDQIAAAQAAAVKDVRDQAITIAVSVAREVVGKQMTAAEGNKLIDQSIATVGEKLH